MSFSAEVKKELTSLDDNSTVLMALIRMNGSLGISRGLTLSITTENATTARYIYTLLLKIYNIKSEIRTQQKTNLSKNRIYTVYIDDRVNNLLDELDLADGLLLDNGVPASVKYDEKKSIYYLRGAFLSSGNVSDPESGKYHLELSSVYQDHAQDLKDILENLGFNAKIIERKNRYVLYIASAEQIMDFLTIIGAMNARLKYENAKIFKEMRNQANRIANFETANLGKTVNASYDMIEKINILDQKLGLENLPENLFEVARIRLENPDLTIKELGEAMTPPLGKSGVNHRLRKLSQMAEVYLEEK
ncbi:DNA-binding protein WhiA [Floricoccus penangensis]|uniref:Probable cell division protein WhiA n=1 Tax=Floricoccus penangensis TaxID=1859475 RepID=A0A9Q5JF86_9LACT|nr:DNA-binding protein WhiA [Floricoccus penangensis]OFI46228.1 DNA-binding protein WhiA [Floricoccus penangensis]URZ86946.1 DNA-binding protein WhiA [Floricoccus penangensis]